jgi:hypothetical protein
MPRSAFDFCRAWRDGAGLKNCRRVRRVASFREVCGRRLFGKQEFCFSRGVWLVRCTDLLLDRLRLSPSCLRNVSAKLHQPIASRRLSVLLLYRRPNAIFLLQAGREFVVKTRVLHLITPRIRGPTRSESRVRPWRIAV